MKSWVSHVECLIGGSRRCSSENQPESCGTNSGRMRLCGHMQHFTFGRNNGLRVSELVLGTGMFGTSWGYGADPDEVRQMFDTFAEAGGTAIDTAASYQVGE